MSNHQAIAEYYAAHRDELLAFVSSRLGGFVESEDIVQDVFTRLLISDKLISEVTLPCLVYTMTRNLITDHFRRRHVYEAYEHYIKGTCSVETSVESVISARELIERMERSLVRLPEKCREVYRMHIYGGMKTAEISTRLGENYKSVEHRLGIARKHVRSYLKVG